MLKSITGVRGGLTTLARLARKHAGKVAYYGGIALALLAIAIAAERYRGAEEGERLLLPSAELPVAAEQLTNESEATLPEGARMLRGYSALPQWNEAFAQWEAHTAVDIAFPEDEVICVLEGEVVAVGRSSAWGGFVEVLCGDRLFRYGSIEPEEGLVISARLAFGERIGRADGSMSGEAEMDAHLHLEVWEGENSVDFAALTAKIPSDD